MKHKVEVYWNLHKDMWSVRKAHGRVLNHTNYIVLHDVDWVVQQAGRRRVLKEGKKNVHAFGRGYLGKALPSTKCIWEAVVKYNPYKYDCFVRKHTETPLYNSGYAVFSIDIWGKPKVISYIMKEIKDDA